MNNDKNYFKVEKDGEVITSSLVNDLEEVVVPNTILNKDYTKYIISLCKRNFLCLVIRYVILKLDIITVIIINIGQTSGNTSIIASFITIPSPLLTTY